MIAGSEDVLAVDELQTQTTDIVHARSFGLVAFHGSKLDAMLRHIGVQALVPVGVSTNVEISGLSLCGSHLGYQVVAPRSLHRRRLCRDARIHPEQPAAAV